MTHSTPEAPPAGPALEGRLFPHLICRVAALPGDSMEDLRAEATLLALTRLKELESTLQERASSLTDTLFKAIDGQEDVVVRRALLRLKRDVHNLRTSPSKALRVAKTALDEAQADALDDFQALHQAHAEQWQAFRQTYKRELTQIRKHFQNKVLEPHFRHGLLLSSRSLSDRIERYRLAKAARPGAKARQVERSLMRYYSRTVMKATPFSTLCALHPGTVTRTSLPGPPRFDGAAGQQASQVRLNKSIYARVLPRILGSATIRRQLCVELNPTLERDARGDSESAPWVFLTAQGEHEVFQRLSHPVVDLIQGWLSERGPSVLREVVAALAEHPEIDTDASQAEAFLEQLLKIGLLRFRLGIAEQEVNWDAPLRRLLMDIDDPVAQSVCRYLAELRGIVDGYPAADLAQRRQKLERCHGLLKEFFADIGAPAPKPGFEAFYEDAGSDTALHLEMGDLEESLADYIRWTSRLAWPRGEMANMRHFFETFYGAGSSVPLLRFYEDYYREHFKEHLADGQRREAMRYGWRPPTEGPESPDEKATEKDNDAKPYNPSNPFDLEHIRQLDLGVRGMHALLQALWRSSPEAEVVHLTDRLLDKALGHLPPSHESVRSATLFMHYLPEYTEDGGPGLVGRSYLAGYGKYFSRFLYLLPPEVQRDLQEHNGERSPHLLAEICGDANFNANLHPPLVPWELSYPTGETGDAATQIHSADVEVEVDPENPHRLRLHHRERDRVVVPVDLGFLNPRMRPPLFQLLTRFAPPDNFTLNIPELPEDGKAPPPVLYRPRIVYRDHIVLARRWWRVSGDVFPAAHNSQGADTFERLQRWRLELGLPQEVFVRIHVLPTPPPSEEPDKVEQADQEAAEAKTSKDSGVSGEASSPAKAQASIVSKASSETASEDQPSSPDDAEAPNDEEDRDAEEARNMAAAQGGVEIRRSSAPPGMREHLYKPQYIDFANPLLVDLLGRGTENLKHFYLTFEECLPGRRQFLHDAEHPYTTELILQMDFTPKSEETT